MADTNLTNLIVNSLTREEYHNADLTDHQDELFVQSDHAGVHIGSVGVDGLDTTNITNCITEIPQDIKLELNAGTLTLKAGSKVYVPNGVDVFDTITIQSDITRTESIAYDATYLIFYYNGGIRIELLSNCYSGSTAPTASTYMNWYDTANNLVKRTNNGGSTWASGYSFPIAIATQTSGTGWISINQVFNGFGYIGSTVFALPGSKVLIPNGRNADGTLKNIELAITEVKTNSNLDASRDDLIYIESDGQIGRWGSDRGNIQYVKKLPTGNVAPTIYCKWYEEYSNLWWATGNTTTFSSNVYMCPLFMVKTDANKAITSLISTKTAFHALDYNDSEYIAHQAMPSDSYVNLTLGTSGTVYTAPADGYFILDKTTAASNERAGFYNSATRVSTNVFVPQSGNAIRTWVVVKKGDIVQINYSASGTTNMFRFIYANGAK